MENNPIKSMQFINYNVNTLEYRINKNFDKKFVLNNKKHLNVEHSFQSTIYFPVGKNKSNGLVGVNIRLGNLKKRTLHFKLK
ncbi:hypothetical protein WR164_12600 [Philodulcilactobacillus myokoensis]|uniref:Uncharacterized protein n=1 Tax=Philodulcilactobacillus myokoensis TaxID=2929573 RepID=A0A9W6B2D8_9LACO|nr:hypothetical protein [Philodulcilactobacillus myokoensis]GLB47281.1 hypothetical protein WR164_12600 [Philodulcilactobacillus myokoensis]